MTILILALLNILLSLWLLRTIARIARLESEAGQLRTELRLANVRKQSTYVQELMPELREAGL